MTDHHEARPVDSSQPDPDPPAVVDADPATRHRSAGAPLGSEVFRFEEMGFDQVPVEQEPVPQRLHFLHSSVGRGVVAIVVGVVAMLTSVAVAVATGTYGQPRTNGVTSATIFDRTIEVFQWLPSQTLIWAAVLSYLVIALTAIATEEFANARTVPDGAPHARPAVRLFRERFRTHPGTTRVTALIPAHNEEAIIGDSLDALMTQSRPPDRIIVVADNCTDDTVAIARSKGVEVFETTSNVERKGGALNQALTHLLPDLYWYDAVLVMDADTRLAEDYVQTAAGAFDTDAGLSAVGGIFYGEGGHGLLGQLQRNEFTRYAGQIKRRRGRVFVLTGTASMFRADALALVAATRGSTIPGRAGDVYDTQALTEDNELTLALKTLGARMISPEECTVDTELMPTWKLLRHQRSRWQRGALENVAAYGFTSATLRYWGQQIGIGYGAVALWTAYFAATLWLLSIDALIVFPFWLAVTGIYVIERVWSVWPGGWRARFLAAPLIIEIAYEGYLQAVFAKDLWDILWARRPKWYHVPPETTAEEVAA